MRRSFRFNSRSLLIVVMLSAITCATIWQFWPQYRAYRARMRFETAAAQLSAGMTVDEISEIVGHDGRDHYSSDAQGAPVALTTYFLDGAWYCIYMKLDVTTGATLSSKWPCTSVEAFRLAVPPASYLPQTQAAKDEVFPTEHMKTMRDSPNGLIEVRASPLQGEDARRAAYIQDFYEHISQRTRSDLGITYDRIPQGDPDDRKD